MDERLRELLNYFVQSDYNVIMMYNPQCRESTQRIIIYRSYITPNNAIFSYTVNGKDITKLIENLKVSNYITPHQSDLGIANQVNEIPNFTYEFSKDYSFELVRP